MKNGIRVRIFGSFDAFHYAVGRSSRYTSTDTQFTPGNAHTPMDKRGSLCDDGIWNPRPQLETEAEAAFAQLKAGFDIGTSYVHVGIEVSVGAGVAEGVAKVTVRRGEVTLKDEIGMTIVRGEVKSEFLLFDADVTLSSIGELDATGIGTEFSSKTGEVESDGEASLFADLGFKVKINY